MTMERPTTAIDRAREGHWNADAYDPAENPGGLDESADGLTNGLALNIEPLLSAMGDMAQWTGEQAAAAGDAASGAAGARTTVEGLAATVATQHGQVQTWHGQVNGWQAQVAADKGTVATDKATVQGLASTVATQHGQVQPWHAAVSGWYTQVQTWQAQVATHKDAAAASAAAAAASAASAQNSDAATKLPLAGGKMTGDLVTPRGGAIGSVASGSSILLGSSGGAQIWWETDGTNDWISFVVHYAGQWHKKVLKIDKSGNLVFTGSAALTTEAGNLTLTSAGGVVLVTGTVIHDGAFFDTANARSNTGAAITLTTRAVQRYLLTANATLTLPTVGTGANVRVRIEVSVKQDATGGRTMTVVAPAGQTVAWSGGSPPALPSGAGKEATFLFERLEGETRWRAGRLWTEDAETAAGLGYRYWRVINDAPVYGGGAWFDIGEVEMYASADTTGFDLTGGRTVTTSTGAPGGVLVDDDPSGNTSCWQVNTNGVGLWFMIDFGTPVAVHSMRLWVASDSTTSRTSPGNARIGSSIRLQYSLDGSTWATSQTLAPANTIGWQSFTNL